MTELTYRPAGELLGQLTAGRLSARELLDAHVVRHEKVHGSINAVVAADLERARSEAQAIDDTRARGDELGPLAGLPMTVKDCYDVEGMPAVAGNPAYVRRAPTCRDAALVAKMRAAGAVIWGKTNVPLMLGDFQSYNAVYGTTNNPHDPTRTPGGSSGGAAAALAAGITALELGSDIGGSLRHPANWCGVYSLKPTWNTLSMRGHIPPPPGRHFQRDLEVAGPMARTAKDLRSLYAVLRDDSPRPPRDIRGSRIALWCDEPAFPVASEVRSVVEATADSLRKTGATVEPVTLPFSADELLDNYLSLLYPIIGSDFPSAVYAALERARVAQVPSENGRLDPYSMTSLAVRATASFRSVADAMADRQAMKDQLADWFAQWDAILAPVSAVVALTHRQEGRLPERTIEVDAARVPYPHLFDWIALATDLHLPALAAPLTRTAAGLPIGVQLIGKWHEEDFLLDLADALERETGGFHPPSAGS